MRAIKPTVLEEKEGQGGKRITKNKTLRAHAAVAAGTCKEKPSVYSINAAALTIDRVPYKKLSYSHYEPKTHYFCIAVCQ